MPAGRLRRHPNRNRSHGSPRRPLMSSIFLSWPRLRGWLAAQQVLRLAALVAVAVFLGDLASKLWASGLAVQDGGHDTWQLTHNTAFAFSAGAGRVDTQLVMVIRLLALYGLAYVFGRKVICDERSSAG